MKKIFVCALALAAFAACQKNEVVEMPQGSAIAFDTFVDRSTKVTDAEDMSKANLTNFGVYGWRTKGAATETVFNAQAVTAENGVCTYSPLQYWQVGYTYQFEAVYPQAGTALTVDPAVGGSRLTFTSDSETDLIWARPAAIDYQTAQQTTVGLTFNHLLSRVMFVFHNQFPENAAAKITVKSVTINDAVAQAEITPAAADRAWAPVEGETADVTFVAPASTAIEPAQSAATEHQYMIPAEMTSVTFTYELDQNGVKNEYTATRPLSGEGIDSNLYLGIARSLRINVVFNAQNVDPQNPLYPIEFSAEVTAW